MRNIITMSQDEVMDYLESKPIQWFRTIVISKVLRLAPSSTLRSLKGLHKRGFIEKREIGYVGKVYEWRRRKKKNEM